MFHKCVILTFARRASTLSIFIHMSSGTVETLLRPRFGGSLLLLEAEEPPYCRFGSGRLVLLAFSCIYLELVGLNGGNGYG